MFIKAERGEDDKTSNSARNTLKEYMKPPKRMHQQRCKARDGGTRRSKEDYLNVF